ncbi:5-oxoprolinase subunit PxpB [Pseudalkalibacillus berkeleyi]|uniref:5-oxoprolinase subunit PxpB n=1 Tax=Pseudalkalibacillus berkeleyi TaxID=1069813 RepID=A0ABS9GXY6_9BACL|nr:5-oxoprolinase subunit PxpB [Pseudalkalibacillus berkeleyi]MCF6136358.1 5-oxoprolinase subunit PxpB [Pseudalkalibacillus berkeleyi]
MKYELSPLGDSAVIVQLGRVISEETHHAVRNVTDYLQDNPIDGMVDYVPAFSSVTIFYIPMEVIQGHSYSKIASPYEIVCEQLKERFDNITFTKRKESRTVEIPVCYEGEFGADLQIVADHNQISVEEVIDIHTSGEYLVYMLGFAPGFPYLGGMSEKIATPRKETPRTSIPAGSVGIAGSQTGIYPIETPGGWQLIGQTPSILFDIEKDPPTLLEPGDTIRFYSISLSEFKNMKEEQG